MESFTSAERRVRPGKTVSPRPAKKKAWAYKEFKIGELFTAQTGDTDLQQKDINGKGTYFINSGVEGLGIKGKTDREAMTFSENTITVDFWGNAYYRDFKYKMATHNHVFSLSGSTIRNRFVGLYLVSTMSYMRNLFSYNNMGTWSKIKKLYITLPISQSGDIDFAYMDSCIREMEESCIREMDAYLNVTGFQNCELTEEEQDALDHINNKRIKEFTISDLYYKVELAKKTFDKRKDSRQIPDSKYCIPLVNAKHGDNGIMYYGDKAIFESMDMTIDIVQNGAIATGDVYPQPHPTGVLWDAYLIRALHHQDTAETLMYMSAAIRKSIKRKYTYDNKAYWEHVKKEIINLPVTPSGYIDYHFMETYIRAIEKQTIQRVKDWRAKEISATKDIVNSDMDNKLAVVENYKSHTYELKGERDTPMMVAEDILIYGSLEVRLRNTKKSELLAGSLDLVLMYAISPAAREKTEKAGRIALGIKEANLSEEAVKAYQSVRYIMFHYWKNSEAKPFALTAPTRLVSRAEVPEGFLLRQEKETKQYLLLEYNPATPASIGELDILKAQRKGCNRYMPFVCRVENIIDSISH
ncbi:MAG: restriction endonuclease subunit S [Prevotella sp.]|nr:restriction endonuclease subunit S [Bacteroidales bacterium]MDY5877735.1 restriction endonuclease subunit S [Prevotella sp.]